MMKGHYGVHPHIGEESIWPPVVPLSSGIPSMYESEVPTMNLRMFKKKDGGKVLQQAWQRGVNLIWKDIPEIMEDDF